MRLTVVNFRMLACPALLLLLAGDAVLGSQAWAQTSSSSSTSTPPPALTFDLGRIRSALTDPAPATGQPKINLRDGRPIFFAETVEPQPLFEKFTAGFNLRSGPVPGAGMTHQEFLQMVTPKNLYSSGGIRAIEQLEWGITNYIASWTIKKLYKELDEARTEWRRKEIQKQIDRELAALKGGK